MIGAKMSPTDRSTTEDWINIEYPDEGATAEDAKYKRLFQLTLDEIRKQPERKLGCGAPACVCHWCLVAPFENLEM